MYAKIRQALVIIAVLSVTLGCAQPLAETSAPSIEEARSPTVKADEAEADVAVTHSPTTVASAEPLTTDSPTKNLSIQVARGPEDAAEMAKKELSKRLSVAASSIEVIRSERTELSHDQLFSEAQQKAGLSLPAEVLGYEVVLRSEGVQHRFYVYRNRVVYAEGR